MLKGRSARPSQSREERMPGSLGVRARSRVQLSTGVARSTATWSVELTTRLLGTERVSSLNANHVLIDATLDVTPRTPDVTPRTPTCRRTESGYFYSHARYRSTTCGRIARNTILIGQLGWVHTSLSDVQLPMAHAVAVIARCWSRTWLTHTGIFRT